MYYAYKTRTLNVSLRIGRGVLRAVTNVSIHWKATMHKAG